MSDCCETLLSSHASCCIIQQFFQDTNFFRDDFLVVTAFQFVKSQTVFSLLYVVPFYHITFKTKVNYFPLNRQLFCNFPTFSNNFLSPFPNFIKKRLWNRVQNLGSIISVVGKTTVEIIELFECRQKVP